MAELLVELAITWLQASSQSSVFVWIKLYWNREQTQHQYLSKLVSNTYEMSSASPNSCKHGIVEQGPVHRWTMCKRQWCSFNSCKQLSRHIKHWVSLQNKEEVVCISCGYSYKDSKVRSHWVISAHLLYGRNTERNELNPQSQSALGQGLLWTTQWYYGNLLCGWRRGFTNLQLQSQPLRPRCLLWYTFSVL